MRWLWRHLACAVAVGAVSAALAAPLRAADEAESDVVAVIPPGQEDVLLAILGRGTALPESCVLAEGRVEYSVVTATYTCPLGAVVIELSYPEGVENVATTTDQFALVVESGSPPESLLDAIAANVRAREDEFHWDLVEAPPVDPASGEHLAPGEPR